jgi:hypothetical protein
MNNILTWVGILALACIYIGCNSNTAPTPNKSDNTLGAATAENSNDSYFSFAIDGKEVSIAEDDISTSYSSGDSTLKIYAGKDGELSIVLTIPALNTCPCTVPAGSAIAGNQLDQGSVSLQNYPEKNYSFNSWYNSMHDTPPAEAIKITNLGTVKNGYRYIAGTFHAKVLKTESNGDKPSNKDYEITNGKFSVKHDTHGAVDF